MRLCCDIQKQMGDFNLSVSFETQGARLGLLGPSGCGKSMTLRCIAGIETPDKGFISLNGQVLFDSGKGIDLRPQHRRVGYLFQNYALFPHMTVRENLAAALKTATGKASEITRLTALLELEGLEKRYPGQLSGGQQQRVALARMLLSDPEIVLLDEPFSALDTHLWAQLILRMREVLEGYHESTVLVTHSLEEAYSLCDRLIVLSRGAVVEQGRPDTLLKRPEGVQTARLIGCKNISRAQKVGEHELLALDWNAQLSTSYSVPDDVCAVGIHAAAWVVLFGKETWEGNHIPVRLMDTVQGPHETSLVVESLLAEQDGRLNRIWARQMSREGAPPPNALGVAFEDVLPLR